jgi:hypothetical protein
VAKSRTFVLSGSRGRFLKVIADSIDELSSRKDTIVNLKKISPSARDILGEDYPMTIADAIKDPVLLKTLVGGLHTQGLGNREIARQLDLPHWQIGRMLPELGLKTNNPRGTPPLQLSPGLFQCKSCGEAKSNSDFSLVKSIADGRRLSTCKACNARKAQDRLKDPIKYWGDRQKRIISRTKGLTPKTNLTTNYLYSAWVSQAGKCFYTDEVIEITLGEGLKRNSPSVDRLIPELGYVEGNVVICTHKANSVKQDLCLNEVEAWLPGWYARIMRYLND